MYTEEELKISNRSYINKDFAQIYPEQIDLIHKMTNRWDPQTSNESDPGIVLIKQNAFIGDKNNYNIDKNVLENFMLSATQESSMRKLCDMNGYYMNYYIAPEVEITFMFTNEKVENQSEGGSFILPALSTVLTSTEDESVNFILTKPVQILRQNIAVSAPAIQGELKTLMGNNSGDVSGADSNQEYIQLSNLDDKNRIYFPESNVAQNGVFITTYDNNLEKESEPWTFTKNLNYEPAGSPVYTFGYDSVRELPYVEFPNDIAKLIASGLRIRYVVTDGLEGNVKANIINSISKTVVEDLNGHENSNYDFSSEEGDSAYLYIRNLSGSINGKNPETIDEAYNGYKKTVGTFNNLVACRDYANAIYNMYDEGDAYTVVSNIQVSDRRDDINYCTQVATYDSYGAYTKTMLSDDITPFDLCCYPLKTIRAYTEDEYYASFKPGVLSPYIQEELEEFKCASHNYKEIQDDDTYLYKNYLTLNANLSTTYKVNEVEKADIIANVEKALIKDFNARNVDYGYEIPYDSLLHSIETADKRISSVSLAEPYLRTKVMLGNGNEADLISADGKQAYINLLSKNILRGNVPLFEYDKNFEFEFGQVSPIAKPVVYELRKISTLVSIELANDTNYKLNPNEYITLLAPNLITKTTYPVNVYYYFDSSTHSYASPVANDVNYKLANGESLVILYTDSEDNDHVIVYGCDSTGTYIKKDNESKEYKEFYIQASKLETSSHIKGLFSANDFMSDQDPNKWSPASYSATKRSGVYKSVVINGVTRTVLFYSLQANESLNIRELTQTRLTKRTNCYWIRNNLENKLFETSSEISNREILLQDGEYFFYTDSSKTSLVSLGSGTTIQFPSSVSTDISCDILTLDEVVDNGILAISNSWKYLAFDSTHPCVITENQILTLGKDDEIRLVGLSESLTLNNTLTSLSNSISIYYKLAEEDNFKPLENFPNTSLNWRIKSRLDIDVSSGDYQVIYEGQSIKVWDKTNATDTPTLEMSESSTNDSIACFNLNLPSHLLGGDDIDVRVLVERRDDPANNVYSWPMSSYYFYLKLEDEEVVSINRDALGYCSFSKDDLLQGNISFGMPSINLNNSTNTKEDVIIMLYATIPNEGEYIELGTYATIEAYNSEIYEGLSIDTSSATHTATISKTGMYILKLSNVAFATDFLSISCSSTFNGSLILGTYDVIKGLNSNLGLEEFADKVEDVTSLLRTSLRGKDFYYNNKTNKTKLIELDSNTTPKFDMLSPYILYDFNNVANKFTMSEIDFKTSKIDIVRSSRL